MSMNNIIFQIRADSSSMSAPNPPSLEDVSSESSSNEGIIKTPSSNSSGNSNTAESQVQKGFFRVAPSDQISVPPQLNADKLPKPPTTGVIFGQTTAMSSPLGGYVKRSNVTQSSVGVFGRTLGAEITDAKSPFANLGGSEETSKLFSNLGKSSTDEKKSVSLPNDQENMSSREPDPLSLSSNPLNTPSTRGGEAATDQTDPDSGRNPNRRLENAVDNSTSIRAQTASAQPQPQTRISRLFGSTIGNTASKTAEKAPEQEKTENPGGQSSLFGGTHAIANDATMKAVLDQAGSQINSGTKDAFGGFAGKLLNKIGKPTSQTKSEASSYSTGPFSSIPWSDLATNSSAPSGASVLEGPSGGSSNVDNSSTSIPSPFTHSQAQHVRPNADQSPFSFLKTTYTSDQTKLGSALFGVSKEESKADNLEARLAETFGKVDIWGWKPHGTSALFDPKFEAQKDRDEAFQSICAMPGYSRYSHEELRLADYAAGWGAKRPAFFPHVIDTNLWYRCHFTITVSPLMRALLSSGRSKDSHPDHKHLADHMDSYATNEPFKTFFGSERETTFAQKIRDANREVIKANAATPTPASSIFGLSALSLTASRTDDVSTEVKIAREKVACYTESFSLWAVSKLDWQEHYDNLSTELQRKPPTTKEQVLAVRKMLDEWEDKHLEELTDMLEKRKKDMEKKVDEFKGQTRGIGGLGAEMVRKHWRLGAALDGL